MSHGKHTKPVPVPTPTPTPNPTPVPVPPPMPLPSPLPALQDTIALPSFPQPDGAIPPIEFALAMVRQPFFDYLGDTWCMISTQPSSNDQPPVALNLRTRQTMPFAALIDLSGFVFTGGTFVFPGFSGYQNSKPTLTAGSQLYDAKVFGGRLYVIWGKAQVTNGLYTGAVDLWIRSFDTAGNFVDGHLLMPAGDSTMFPRIAGALAQVANGIAFFRSVDSNHTLDVQVFDPATFAPVQFIKNWTAIAGEFTPFSAINDGGTVVVGVMDSSLTAHWYDNPPTMDPAHDYPLLITASSLASPVRRHLPDLSNRQSQIFLAADGAGSIYAALMCADPLVTTFPDNVHPPPDTIAKVYRLNAGSIQTLYSAPACPQYDGAPAMTIRGLHWAKGSLYLASRDGNGVGQLLRFA